MLKLFVFLSTLLCICNTAAIKAAGYQYCWTGYEFARNGSIIGSIGEPSYCPGECTAFTSRGDGDGGSWNTTIYGCGTRSYCNAMELDNRCTTLNNGANTDCCCDYKDNCNAKPYVNTTVPINTYEPIICLIGTYENQTALFQDYPYQVCRGSCISVSSKSYINGIPTTITDYSCWPNDLLMSLGIYNECQIFSLNNPYVICGCNSDACLGPHVAPLK